MNDEFRYIGDELQVFAGARNWKAYLRRQIGPYLGGAVLEVGAGLGGTTRQFCPPEPTRWVCLEPDPALADELRSAIAAGDVPARCEVVVGTLESAGLGPEFDTALYIDVLEHIEDDLGEVGRAMQVLRPGGHLVVLSPAHNFLYSPFDKAIGHYRRYDRPMLRRLTPPAAEVIRLVYLDSFGLLASLGNRLLLRSAQPNAKQVAFWDRVLVRTSTVLDPLLLHAVGKSVLAVWRKT